MLGGFLGQTYGTYSPSAMRTEWVIRFLFSWFVFLGCAVSCAFFGYEI
jgi:TRAP-type C4-dicarboxylate transport system permease small subunit